MGQGRFNIVYPGKGKVLFDGGKNNKYERSIIEDNESPDCLNVVFNNGAVETRGGTTKLNTTSVGTFVGDGLYTRRSNAGAETMCAWWNGTLYALGGTSTFTTVPSGQSVFTAGQRVGATQYENYIFFGNGGSPPYKYDGTNFTRHGIPAPTVTSTVASQAVGVITGEYRYKVTYVNSALVEGNPGPATATFTAAGATLRLTSLPIAPQSYGVSARRIYRATNVAGATYRRVAEISDNSTTTYDDNTADASLGVAAPSDAFEPPNWAVAVTHQNRLFVIDPANPNQVNYSGLGEPYTFGATAFLTFADATSDLPKTLGVHNNHLVVGCENSHWLVYMPSTDPSDWQTIRIKTAYGSKSPHGIVNVGDALLMPAVQNGKFVGFAAIQGDSVAQTATLLTVAAVGSDLQSDRIEPDMFEVQETYLKNISAIVFKNRAWFSVTYEQSNTTNNRVFYFDFSQSNLSRRQKGAWVPFTGINAAQFAIYNGRLYYQDSQATGRVYQAETTSYNDDGAAINSYYYTKEYPGHDGSHKDFRSVTLLVEKSGDWPMALTYKVDSDRGGGVTIPIDLDPGGSTWGTMIYGTDPWGGGTDQEEVREPLGQARGKRIQFKFSNNNTADRSFKVHWMEFGYNKKGIR